MWLWPSVSNLKEAESAAEQGAGAAAFVAFVTGTIAVVSIVNGKSYFGLDGWSILDSVIFAVVAWRLYRHSFPWAIAGLVLYAAEAGYAFASNPAGIGTGSVMRVLFISMFISSLRGTYYLRRHKDEPAILV